MLQMRALMCVYVWYLDKGVLPLTSLLPQTDT